MAGRRMLRMTIASRKTAVAIATPKSLIARSSPVANDTNTATITAAVAVMTRPVKSSDYVLIIGSRAYTERWEGTASPRSGAGAAREANALEAQFEMTV
jgi:hypothetical protein